MHKFEISTLLELIQRHRVSVAAVVPPLVLTLAKNPAVADYDLSSLRIVLSGAAPLGKELEEALHKRVHKAVFGQCTGNVGVFRSWCLTCYTCWNKAQILSPLVFFGTTGKMLNISMGISQCEREHAERQMKLLEERDAALATSSDLTEI